MKIIRRIVCAAAVLVLVGLGVWAYVFHARGERTLENYKAQLRASGEKLTIDAVLREIKPVEGNSVSAFQKTLPFLHEASFLNSNLPPAMRMVAPGRAMAGWAQPNLRDAGTNSWEELGEELAAQQEAFDLWHQIGGHAVLNFHLDYHAGFSLLLPHLAPLKQASQRLSAAVSYDLHRGELEAAVTNIGTMLAIVKGMKEEPLVISQLVRMAIAQITMAATWELLQAPGATDAQLVELRREWEELEFSRATENSLLLERAMVQEMVAKMRESSDEFRRVAGGWGMGPSRGSGGPWFEQGANLAVLKGKETMWRFKWSSEDELRGLKGQQAIIESLRRAREEGCFKPAIQQQRIRLVQLGLQVKSDEEGRLFDMGEMDMRSLISQTMVSLQSVPYRLMTIEAARQMVLSAIALKRFQLRHGKYPGALVELAPEFLAAVPRDPTDGQPLRYRVQPDGAFLLYSAGEDGEDNGGDAMPKANSKTFPWQKGKDWVWPRAATAEEVANYFQKLDSERQPRKYQVMPAHPELVSTNHQEPNSGK